MFFIYIYCVKQINFQLTDTGESIISYSSKNKESCVCTTEILLNTTKYISSVRGVYSNRNSSKYIFANVSKYEV